MKGITKIIYAICLAAVLLVSGFSNVQAQVEENSFYLLFEFMQVDNEQEAAYQETETFWKKIHEERVKSGEIVGWDLWSLQPGGEMQGFQYLTVTIFDDRVKMMGDIPFMEHAVNAYPDLSSEELSMKFEETSKSRDLAVRLYLEQIDHTNGEFEMKVGTVASIDLMKVDLLGYQEYEQAEMEIFKPAHQQMVNAGNKGSWELLRIINPIGSETYASHITINMYENWTQFFEGSGAPPITSPAEGQMTVEEALETRDMKFVYIATLREMVR